MEFRRPMTMDEVVEYVAEMSDQTLLEVRLSVDNTLTAAWLHGFVERDNELYSLNLPDKLMTHSSSTSSIAQSTHSFSSNRPSRSHSSQNFQWYSYNRGRR